MAPYTAALPAYHNLDLSDKNRFKLRKPLVEKMRRDRINTCIEQLKSLLEKKVQSQDPNAKLEKADILEMTVSFLRRQRHPGPVQSQRDYKEGYSQCWRESVQFLNASSSRGVPFREHPPEECLSSSSSSSSSSSFPSTLSPVTSKQSSVSVIHHAGSKRPVWRPWH
ncbi:transcription factor HES-5-like isoform X2 [Alosa sapidissima]|nr:transcription factor HES-5-like isoform X2 [Alosa sapidissima]XP_041953332.1 transcription factor HES-5-like isoform X2 [Alosa sapidissima]